MSLITGVILAAGQGKRMHSVHPKVLHHVAGKPMLLHVLEAARGAGVDDPIVVVGHGREELLSTLPHLNYVVQEAQMGTGHAVAQAKTAIPKESSGVLVLCGDTPLLTAEVLGALVEHHRVTGAAATILTAELEDPQGYGRILRDGSWSVQRIVEQRDANPAEAAIREINSGTYIFEKDDLFAALENITPDNSQGEYYLTDVIRVFCNEGKKVSALKAKDPQEVLGINDRIQLARAGEVLHRRKNRELMLEGVTIVDPATTWVDADVTIGQDTILLPGTLIEGSTVIGRECRIGPSCRLRDCRVGEGSQVQYAVLVGSSFGRECKIGPFAYIRPDSKVGNHVKIGDFVEIKKTTIGDGSKVPHHTYLGDSLLGANVNIGAGTITCNYDGEKKSVTTIRDNVFVGSNSNLVAPVEIGKNAYIAAGSTINENVPEDSLAIARQRQTNIEGWVAKKGKKKE